MRTFGLGKKTHEDLPRFLRLDILMNGIPRTVIRMDTQANHVEFQQDAKYEWNIEDGSNDDAEEATKDEKYEVEVHRIRKRHLGQTDSGGCLAESCSDHQ
jgi:hypothetical protein